jgi:octaprenyl-diphosphate synthase
MPGYRLENILSSVEDDLKHVERYLLQYIGLENQEISDTLVPLLIRGGKRIRPALTVLSSGACGKRDEDTIRYAALVELVHTASLFHDDVIDEATTRRGSRSANKILGNQLAVLAGDYFYSKAISLVIPATEYVQRAVNKTVLEMTEGEIYQSIHLFQFPSDTQLYLKIIEKKTAALMALACTLGAVLSGSSEQVENLTEYGRNLGLAFQMIDDLLDWISEDTILGKNIFQDVRDGRITLPAMILNGKLPLSSGSHFRDILTSRKDPDTNELLEYRALMIEYGIDHEIREMAMQLSRNAISCLRNFSNTQELEILRALPEILTQRWN